MNAKRILAAAAVLLIAATACSPEAEKQKAATPEGASAATPASEVQHGKGEGTITAIDAAKGTITLDHGEIPALQWPPMAMGFKAPSEMLKGLKVGDRIAFELDWNGAEGQITRVDAISTP